MLLLCVSSTDSCRGLLSQPRWIAVLLGLLRLGPPYAQRRALRLLRRLLPHCDPESLAEKNDGVQASADGVDWSIVTIVKESGAGAVALATARMEGDARSDGANNESNEMAGMSGSSEMPSGSSGRVLGRGIGGPSPMVRVTSLSNSVHADLIPARSLLCFFLDAIGGSYQATPRPEWLGDAETDGSSSGGGSGADERSSEGTLRDLRSWYRNQSGASSSGQEHGRSAWAFSQLEGPLVCESVSLLRTLLQTPGWGDVTATLLQDAFQRGNSCLRLLAREAADKAEAAPCDTPTAVSTAAAAARAPVGTGAEIAQTASGGGGGAAAENPREPASGGLVDGQASAEGETAGGGTPGLVPPAVVPVATAKPPHLPASTAEAAGRAPLAGASSPPGTTDTLLRTLGALSVLGGHVDVLYPGASAEIMPFDYASRAGGGGSRSGRSSQGSSGWGARMGRSVFGLSGLERAVSAANGGDGRGRGGGGGWGAPAAGGSSNAADSTGGGRPCVVVSLNLAEMHAEVMLESGVNGEAADSGGGGGGGGSNGAVSDARKPRVVPLDCLQAVPNVPVRTETLPSGLAQRILETFTLWCLDKGLNAAFSERLSPTAIPFVPAPTPAAASSTPPPVGGGDRGGEGFARVLSTAVLDRHLLLGLVRCQAAKAAQTLLLHPQTASDFVKSASASAPGRKAKGGAGAVLLEVASGVSSSAGLGDIGAMEELVAMLLSHWQFSVLDERSKRVQKTRWVLITGGLLASRRWRIGVRYFNVYAHDVCFGQEQDKGTWE